MGAASAVGGTVCGAVTDGAGDVCPVDAEAPTVAGSTPGAPRVVGGTG